MKIITINQKGVVSDIKENDLDNIVGGYSIVDVRNTKEHSVVNHNNKIVNVYTLRMKVA